MNEIDGKQRILNIASEKFMEAGFSKVTLDEIATDLGMSKKTVYKFFPSKEELLKSIVKLMMSQVEQEVTLIVKANESFERKITRLLALIGKQMRKFSKQFQIDIQRYAPTLWKEIEIFRRDRIFSQVKKMFEQAKQENIFRSDLDINLFFLIFTSTVHGIMNPKILTENSFSAEDAFHGIINTLFEGVLTKEARKKIHYYDINYE